MKFSDMKFEVDDGVYPPSEDTYLLLGSIELGSADSFLEIGCGAGLISLAAARVCRNVVAIDVSLDAVMNTLRNMRINALDVRCTVIQSDLLSALRREARYSVIAFNPPYLPEDGDVTAMDFALVGGRSGVELTEKFISQAIPHLEEDGRIYVVVTTLADIERISDYMKSEGLQVEAIAEAAFFFESIQVLQGSA
ncbi:MAG: HemK2/MTQ2 family protein methyltransferase [Candidatus Thorarchaeota archaeon]